MLQFSALLIPLIFIVVWLDYRRCAKMGIDAYNPERSVANISIGITEQITALASMAAIYFWIDYLYHYSFFQLSNRLHNWMILFFLSDFCFYWSHRASHKINFFWANHITHHQSEDYNLLVGFRLGSFQFLARFFFWAPMPLLGFKMEWIASVLIVSGLYEWLLHTRTVGKLGVLEYIFMTPSSHRVHHGKNDEYIDKNYGSTFSIWDRLFGTYIIEEAEVKFGIKSPWKDDNPYMSSFQHYVDTFMTARHFKRPIDKLMIWLKPPGWLPNDAEYKYEHLSDNSKPILSLSPAFSFYIHSQLSITIVYFMVFSVYHQILATSYLTIAGLWLLLSALNIGFLVSRKSLAKDIELLRFILLFVFSVYCLKLQPFAIIGVFHMIISILWIKKLSERGGFNLPPYRGGAEWS